MHSFATQQLRIAALVVVLGWTPACAVPPRTDGSSPPVPVATPKPGVDELDPEAAAVLQLLSSMHTADEMRDFLAEGFTEAELNRVGFDEVSLAQCIEDVVQAVTTKASANAALLGCLALRRECIVRRRAGKAPCLPVVR